MKHISTLCEKKCVVQFYMVYRHVVDSSLLKLNLHVLYNVEGDIFCTRPDQP